MLVKKIEHEDFDGNSVVTVAMFNFSKPELVRMDLAIDEGIENHVRTLVNNNNKLGVLDFFEKFLLGSYGVKSADGKSFRKSAELSEEFKQTAAYITLFEELFTDEEAAVAFFKAVLPQPEVSQAVS